MVGLTELALKGCGRSRGIQSDCAQFVLICQDAGCFIGPPTVLRRREHGQQFAILLNLRVNENESKDVVSSFTFIPTISSRLAAFTFLSLSLE